MIVDGAVISAPILTGVNPGGVTKRYSLASDSRGCEIDGQGAVTGTVAGTGTCKVILRLSITNYIPLEYKYVIDVSRGSWGSATWGGYAGGNEVSLGDSSPERLPPASTPTADSWYYRTDTTSVCRVKSGNGELTFVGAGDCVVVAVPRKAQYSVHQGVSVTVVVNPGDQSAPSWAADPYGANPAVDVAGSVLSLSGTKPVGQGALKYQVLAADQNHLYGHPYQWRRYRSGRRRRQPMSN